MIWVGKNLAEQGVISCIYYARDVDKARSAIAFAYAVVDEDLFVVCPRPWRNTTKH